MKAKMKKQLSKLFKKKTSKPKKQKIASLNFTVEAFKQDANTLIF